MEKQEYKNLSDEEKMAEWDKFHQKVVGWKRECKIFARENIELVDYYNNYEKRIPPYEGAEEFVNFNGEIATGMMCKHCGKMMINRKGSPKVLGRLVRLMMKHLETKHGKKMSDYFTSLSMYNALYGNGWFGATMTVRDGIE